MTGIDRAIADALDVAPSPEFVARVRQRIANEPKPRPAWFTWRVGVGVAAAAAIVLVVALAWRSNGTTPSSVALDARSLNLSRGALVLSPEVRLPRETYVVSAVRRTVGVAVGTRTAETRASVGPEVLIPRAELEMYRRLIARPHEAPGPVVAVEPTIISAEAAPEAIVIEPIRIEPIMPPSGGQGERQ